MKRVAIGDVHLSAYKEDVLDNDGLPLRLSNLVKSIIYVCEYCVKNNIKYIDIVGDLCNDKDIMYTDSIVCFKDILMKYCNITFCILSGNHDMSSIGQNQKSSISVFQGFPNVKCYMQSTHDFGVDIIPYSRAIVNDIKSFNATSNILLSHVGVSEATVQSGMSIVSDIKMRDFNKWKLVILGHYHKPQVLQNDNTILYYTGNLIHTSWGDKNDKKRFLVYDTETLHIESHYLDGFQEYRELVIDDDTEDVTKVFELAEQYKKSGHKVRIKNKKQGLNLHDTHKDSSVTILEEKEDEHTDRGITITMTTEDKLKKFLSVKSITVNEQKEYLDSILPIITKAKGDAEN